MTREEILRDYYAGWGKKDWTSLDRQLTDYFTFTSPNGDDHINRAAFYAKCWPEAPWVDRFELESVAAGENDAFVRYLCHTCDGRSFRNVGISASACKKSPPSSAISVDHRDIHLTMLPLRTGRGLWGQPVDYT